MRSKQQTTLHWLSFVCCSFRLGLHRESEKQFRSALNHHEAVDTYLYLAKVLFY